MSEDNKSHPPISHAEINKRFAQHEELWSRQIDEYQDAEIKAKLLLFVESLSDDDEFLTQLADAIKAKLDNEP